MYETRISILNVLNNNKAQSIISKLSYSIDKMRRCYLDSETSEIVIITDEEDENIVRIVDELIKSEISTREFKQKILREKRLAWENGRTESVPVNYDRWVKSEQGHYLLTKVDKLFQGISQLYQAQPRRFRSFISRKTLERCNYVHTFPQNQYLVSEFPHNLNAIRGLRENNSYDQYTQPSEFLLSPAVCFHCYEELQDQTLTEPIVITANAPCYRHEAQWRVNNYRRKEFYMREIVYVGPSQFVEDTRHQLMDRIWWIFDEMGFHGKVETASDPFYFVEDQDKGLHQLFTKMKYELVVVLKNGESFAIASFNNVAHSLCSVYNIKSESGEYMHSGCAAFGLDRWVYALLVEFGTDLSAWPDSIKATLKI